MSCSPESTLYKKNKLSDTNFLKLSDRDFTFQNSINEK